ncbi:Transcriptional activator protein anr [Sterolibacterium denitrificans]|uniref:Transcriptional activator protein anr n=1 Tax=Sterolibacterium denitrificans TaxID=157592 RepID=A0A7Z7MVM0_9PROT|nr:fumarate/nitrate reduction transcriptional regulator Fnr [Sterolibacterium denitrificans]SMB27626.1 Transcriptional activator protein anr [Sterolibacterium denitrificans]
MEARRIPLRATQLQICEPVACKQCGVYQLCMPLGLERADMTLLDRIVKRKEVYKRGQLLFRPRERFSYIYAIRSGSAKTSITTDDGRVQITGFHVAGELLGLSALASRFYTSEARALETMSVCKVDIACLDEVLRDVPAIQYQMMKIMSEQIRRDEELMLLLGKCSAEERIAEFLISLSRRFASRNYSGSQFRLSMSRLDIGNYLGLAEETVCRIFSRFQEGGLITTERRNIRLNDLKQLSAVAHIDAAA